MLSLPARLWKPHAVLSPRVADLQSARQSDAVHAVVDGSLHHVEDGIAARPVLVHGASLPHRWVPPGGMLPLRQGPALVLCACLSSRTSATIKRAATRRRREEAEQSIFWPREKRALGTVVPARNAAMGSHKRVAKNGLHTPDGSARGQQASQIVSRIELEQTVGLGSPVFSPTARVHAGCPHCSP